MTHHPLTPEELKVARELINSTIPIIEDGKYPAFDGSDITNAGPTSTSGTWTQSLSDGASQVAFPPPSLTPKWYRTGNIVRLEHFIDLSVFATAFTPDILITGIPFSIEDTGQVFAQLTGITTQGGVPGPTAMQGFSDLSTRLRILMYAPLETGSGRINCVWTYTTTDP